MSLIVFSYLFTIIFTCQFLSSNFDKLILTRTITSPIPDFKGLVFYFILLLFLCNLCLYNIKNQIHNFFNSKLFICLIFILFSPLLINFNYSSVLGVINIPLILKLYAYIQPNLLMVSMIIVLPITGILVYCPLVFLMPLFVKIFKNRYSKNIPWISLVNMLIWICFFNLILLRQDFFSTFNLVVIETLFVIAYAVNLFWSLKNNREK